MELDKKRIIESALFISARGIGLDELGKLTGIAAPGFVKTLSEELAREYVEKGSAIEIIEIEGKWFMRVKDEYAEKVKEFAQQAELSKGGLRTLAYIAKHDGVLKSEIVKKISPQIYQDVKELIQNGFVKQTKAGRSTRLFLTEKFKQYFKSVETKGQQNLNQI